MDFHDQFAATAPAWKVPCTIWRLNAPISINSHKLFSSIAFAKL